MIGSAITGAISMALNIQLMVPHGGVFVLFIPNAVTHLLNYIIAIAAGTVVTAGMLFILKKPLTNAGQAQQVVDNDLKLHTLGVKGGER
jgi:PTS system fructose-specific IIC component